jgi:hypothetical protein
MFGPVIIFDGKIHKNREKVPKKLPPLPTT